MPNPRKVIAVSPANQQSSLGSISQNTKTMIMLEQNITQMIQTARVSGLEITGYFLEKALESLTTIETKKH